MRVAELKIKLLRGVKDLYIRGIPESAKLVVLLGPNGCGKSTVFQAFRDLTLRGQRYNVWRMNAEFFVPASCSDKETIVHKIQSGHLQEDTVSVRCYQHEAFISSLDAAHICVRTAYRHENVKGNIGQKLPSIVESNESKQRALIINNDSSLNENYNRLADLGMSGVYARENRDRKAGEIVDENIGEIRSALKAVFGNERLYLENLASPLTAPTFHFSKGENKKYPFNNLSGGERAAFNLILDAVIKLRELKDVIYALDEPELHIGSDLQAKLLKEIFKLVKGKSQLWIATHSPGMVRAALDLYQANPEEVCFLDFSDFNIDGEGEVIEPTKPTRIFWEKYFKIASEDLGVLLCPKQIVLCEGNASKANESFDAKCYEKIFGDQYPETQFISVGSKTEVQKPDTYLPMIKALNKDVNIIRLRDRDECNDTEIEDLQKEGVRVLKRRELENYLFDSEVIQKLCEEKEKPEVFDEITAKISSIVEDIKSSNVKSKRQALKDIIVSKLDLTNAGDTTKAFMQDTLAPCIQPSMKIYDELEKIIFSPDSE